jgi:predicted DNA-binding transcriptional regulator AlpA
MASRSSNAIDRLLTLHEAEQRLGWKRGRLYRLIGRRQIPHQRIDVGVHRIAIFIRESDLAAWITAQTIQASSPNASPHPAPSAWEDEWKALGQTDNPFA